VEVLETAPTMFMTPCKKKSFKVREKLDDNFLRCNKRISKKLDGFKDEENAKKAKKTEKEDEC
jgi:hypothetical protein